MNERGNVSLELALVTPALMLLVLGVLQFGLWYHAQNVVETAALEGARVAAAEDGTSAAGKVRVMEVLDAGLRSTTTQRGAGIFLGQESARVRVTARLRAILPIPGLSSFPLSSEASVFRERFRQARDGP
jgi:Flp pilus assembly protein TadG